MDAFRPKPINARVLKLGRRYSLVRAAGAYVVFDTRRPARPGERFPASDRAQALARYHALDDRLGSRIVWLYPSGQTLAVSAAVIAGLVFLTGLLAVRGETSTPALLGGVFTVAESEGGVPYIAIDPHALGQGDDASTTAAASEDGKGGGKGSSRSILLFPTSGGSITFGGGDPPPGTDPKPGPGPQPSPDPSPSPDPRPSPSPSPSPSPTPPPPPPPGPGPFTGPLARPLARPLAVPGTFARALAHPGSLADPGSFADLDAAADRTDGSILTAIRDRVVAGRDSSRRPRSVGRAGFEPATRGLKAPCSDQAELPPRRAEVYGLRKRR